MEDESHNFTYKNIRFDTVKTYLDILHSIDCDHMELHTLVELLKFLRCDGMQYYAYEKQLYADLFQVLASKKLSSSVMLLIVHNQSRR